MLVTGSDCELPVVPASRSVADSPVSFLTRGFHTSIFRQSNRANRGLARDPRGQLYEDCANSPMAVVYTFAFAAPLLGRRTERQLDACRERLEIRRAWKMV